MLAEICKNIMGEKPEFIFAEEYLFAENLSYVENL